MVRWTIGLAWIAALAGCGAGRSATLPGQEPGSSEAKAHAPDAAAQGSPLPLCPEACCSSGSKSCQEEAERLYNRPLDLTPQRYEAILRAGCGRGELATCLALSLFLRSSPAVPSDPTAADRVEKQACEGGHGIACWTAARTRALALPPGAEKDPVLTASLRRAAELTLASCDQGDAASCQTAASLAPDDTGGLIDQEKATALLARAAALHEQSCNKKEVKGCRQGALLASSARGGKNIPLAIGLFEKACALGSAMGCSRLGGAIVRGAVPGREASEGVKLLERACDDGQHADACFALGDLARDGKLVPGGAPVTKARFDRAFSISRARCDLGDFGGCSELLGYIGAGVMEAETARSTIDYAEAVCKRGDALLCMDLAQTLKHGRFADEERAKRAFDQACSFGHPICSKKQTSTP